MPSTERPLASAKRHSTRSSDEGQSKAIGWTFLTNHSHVLLALYRDPNKRLRDIAVAVGITERMVHRIVVELVQAGYLKVTKEGRRNHYIVNRKLPLRHPLESHNTIGKLLAVLCGR